MAKRVELQFDDMICLVDDEDYDRVVAKGTWYWDGRYVRHKKNGKRNGPNKPRDLATYTYLHRFVLGLEGDATEDDHVHHEDGNTLNCQKYNLDPCGRKLNNKAAAHLRDYGERLSKEDLHG